MTNVTTSEHYILFNFIFVQHAFTVNLLVEIVL